jgi:hypothetical protein
MVWFQSATLQPLHNFHLVISVGDNPDVTRTPVYNDAAIPFGQKHLPSVVRALLGQQRVDSLLLCDRIVGDEWS